MKIILKWILLVVELVALGWMWTNKTKVREIINPIKFKTENILDKEEVKEEISNQVVLAPEVKITIVPTKVPTQKKKPTVVPTVDNEPWGVAKQVDEVTWTMKVGEDEKMATAQEVFEALNEYRRRYGSQTLTWDTKLGEYAQTRAKYLNNIKSVDKHEGFNNFVENEDGFNKLGFTMLGENISYGYKLNGVHIIEWMYAGDKPHNDNQLDNRWNFAGVGVEGLATCLIFGTGKM